MIYFGQSSDLNGTIDIAFSRFSLCILLILMLLLGAFATTLGLFPPKGPQPLAYGHMQTLANLIDGWGDDGKSIYWGDKTAHDQNRLLDIFPGGDELMFRRAGTATSKSDVGPVKMDAVYL